MTSPQAARPWFGWIGLAARLVLGVVLLVAGALKVGSLGESVLAVRAYQLLPYELTEPVGVVLPFVEIVVGLMLITGTFTRLAGILGLLFMVAFIFAIGSAWARGLSLDCGCFGGGGVIPREEALAAYPWEIARDVALGACGLWLALFPRTPFSVDRWIHGPAAEDGDLIDDDLTDEEATDAVAVS